jgi:hypothetical protein
MMDQMIINACLYINTINTFTLDILTSFLSFLKPSQGKV